MTHLWDPITSDKATHFYIPDSCCQQSLHEFAFDLRWHGRWRQTLKTIPRRYLDDPREPLSGSDDGSEGVKPDVSPIPRQFWYTAR